MRDNSDKMKLLTVGIAVVLIVIICGISFVIHGINKRANQNVDNKLQDDIIEYVNSTQNQGSQNIESSDVKKKGQEDVADEVKDEMETGEPAVVVEKEENKEEESIIEEEKVAAEQNSQTTTAKWQKEVSEDLSKVEIDLSRQMSEMSGYWEAGNMKAVEDLAYLPRYRAASGNLTGTAKYYYFGDTDGNNRPNGKGLAMYADNQYYYGEWKNGVRSGSGMWIRYFVYDKNEKAKDSLYLQHSYSGNWAGDLPNGSGAEHYDFIEENLEEKVGYNRNFIGNFKNGFYDGEIYITDYYKGGNSKEWSGTAKHGVWQPLGEKDKKGQYPVIVEIKNADNYQWMPEKENMNQGVNGLISAAKQ